MVGFELKREESAGKVILRLHGVLDGAAARELHLAITAVDPRLDLVVDFSQVKEFYDYSVGVLTRTLSARPARLQGLRQHQARMFEYFGIPSGNTVRAYYTPEELLVA